MKWCEKEVHCFLPGKKISLIIPNFLFFRENHAIQDSLFLYIFSKFKPWLIKGNGKLLKKGVHCIFSSFPPYFPRCLYSAVNHSYRCYDNSNFRLRFPQISLLIGCCWSLVVAVVKWRLLECDPPQSPWLKKTPTWSGASRANILPLSRRISLLFELSETTSIPLPSGSSQRKNAFFSGRE